MTRSNPIPLLPSDEDINRTLRLLARERELAEARSRSEERGQQFGPGVRGVEVEEVEGEPDIGVEMAGNQREVGAAQDRNLNDAATEEEIPRKMGYYMAHGRRTFNRRSCTLPWRPTISRSSRIY
ncbi:unnamed protein product [Linum trigynum]|uniref:Uncharacterized protein n=1 Tax=Linum trigynum TaxID=586398 RepID=A0AAV2DAP7_9ROSI